MERVTGTGSYHTLFVGKCVKDGFIDLSERNKRMKKNLNHRRYMYGPAFSVLLLFIAGLLNIVKGNNYIAVIEGIMGISIAVYMAVEAKIRAAEMTEFMTLIAGRSGNITNEVLSHFPKPMLVLNVDGKIVWYNDKALEMFSLSDLYDISLPSLITELKWTDILKTTDVFERKIDYDGRHYALYGNIIIRKEENGGKDMYSVIIYFDDITESVELKRISESEKVDVALIAIDNYDDVFQVMDDNKSQETMAKINSAVSKWVSESVGVMKKIGSDRYLIFFEHQYLDGYIKKKFDILEKVRAIGDEIKEPVTISIGIGVGGHPAENEANARNAVEMVWGRGGDQVAVKYSDGQYKLYGGAAKDYEKSTRVKTRMFATALREMIKASDKVIFMGHSSADYDCFGAAIGLSRAVRLMNKKPYIVLDNSPAVKPIYDEMMKHPEYQDTIINANGAIELVEKETLLVILDTHRPSMLPAPDLLKKASKIVLIDHHRRSTEFIDNLSLSYLEPYASSTCEMVTEILQYIDDKKQLSNFEAKALYVGIFMDSKNFVTKTGIRTFEAASYLKRYGVNTMEVKRLFNLRFDDYVRRTEIIRHAEIWNSDMAVSVCTESYTNMRVISSQAADEMLNISGIKAAFVIYPTDNGSAFSARSYPDVNVQLIMEKLGGGGHMTVAGCQIKGISVDEARNRLKDAIKEYIEDNN